MCVFCAEFDAPGPGRVVARYDADLLLFPTLGAFVPGYSLLTPREHHLSFAQVASNAPSETAKAATDARDLIESVYGTTIVAEHGVGTCATGSACVSHAHLHFIPVPDPQAVLERYERIGGPGQTIGSITDLATKAGGAYLYLSITPEDHRVWRPAGFERQFVRKVCSDLHGIGDEWDWAEHPHLENMDATITALAADLAA